MGEGYLKLTQTGTPPAAYGAAAFDGLRRLSRSSYNIAESNYICKYTVMRSSWGETKNRRNLERHGVAFEDAIRIFDGPTLERIDDRFDYGETRIYAIGLVNEIEITVIYTDRGPNERRMISAWRSEPHERRAYWKNLKI